MIEDHLVPAGQRYLWPFPGPVHLRKEEHDTGSGWNPADGHDGTEDEDEGEDGGVAKASIVMDTNPHLWRGGGLPSSMPPAGKESHVQFPENYGRSV